MVFRQKYISACLLSCLYAACFAEEMESTEEGSRLPVVVVKETPLDRRIYTKEDIDLAAKGNRDITSLISGHSAIRLDPTTSAAGNRGSMAPVDFSIHGESPYQNQILIDGASMSNVISPHDQNLSEVGSSTPSFSQLYNLDVDLLENIEVMDNRISVEYGGFTGGVVSAEIKKPLGTNQVSFKKSFNSSKITEQKIDSYGKSEQNWLAGVPGKSAEWRKGFNSISADVSVFQDTNALIAFSRRESKISRDYLTISGLNYAAGTFGTERKRGIHGDVVDNLMVKVSSKIKPGLNSDFVIKMADRKEEVVSSLVDNDWINRQNSKGISYQIESSLSDLSKVSYQFAHDVMDSKRENEAADFVTYRFSGKPNSYSYTTGGLGTQYLRQINTLNKFKSYGNGFSLFGIGNKYSYGLEWVRVKANFHRPNAAASYIAVVNSSGGVQSISNRTDWLAGSVGVVNDTYGIFFNNESYVKNLVFSSGFRVEKSTFIGDVNFAPRFKIDYDVFGDGHNNFFLGWSRYYGADIIGYALEREKWKLRVPSSGATIRNHYFENVKTPYSDEAVIGYSFQLLDSLRAKIEYVGRKSRNGITREGSDTKGYWYSNNGKGKTDSYNFSIETLAVYGILGGQWQGRFDLGWQRSKRNQDMTLGWTTSENNPDDIVLYNGVQMERNALPVIGFNVPRKISANINAAWGGLRWGNRINWTSKREAIVQTAVAPVDTYISEELPDYVTWDTTISWKPNFNKKLNIGLEIINLTNRMPATAISRATTNRIAYTTGREIWLHMSYDF